MRSIAKPSCARLYQGVAVEGTEIHPRRRRAVDNVGVAFPSDFQARFSARHFHGLRALVGTQSGISAEHSIDDCCRTQPHIDDAYWGIPKEDAQLTPQPELAGPEYHPRGVSDASIFEIAGDRG